MKILVTGAAGFIGYTLSLKLLERGDIVVGIDNINNYYDPTLKEARLSKLRQYVNFDFQKLDLCDHQGMATLFKQGRFDAVVNLAAQAGVRYSLTNPQAYIDANLVGFANVLEGARHSKVKHLVFASSSSVYGLNTRLPFMESDNVNHPVSLYAATKKANELMAHSYAYSFELPCTGLRFFTVYGPWGRPDMALFLFTKAILAREAINVFNHGNMMRDFTYVDDIVEGIVKVIEKPATPDLTWSGTEPNAATSQAPYRIFNIGNNKPMKLMRYIQTLEDCLGIKAKINMLPMQSGDVIATSADISRLQTWINFQPQTKLEDGIQKFVTWYREYYQS